MLLQRLFPTQAHTAPLAINPPPAYYSTHMAHFDFIIAGGGAAGLSLALRLVGAPFGGRSLLIVDRERKQENDRTWCFWKRDASPFDALIYRRWNKIAIHRADKGANQRLDLDLSPYSYRMLRGADFYRHAMAALEGNPRVHFHYGEIERIEEGATESRLLIDGSSHSADWIFDSRIDPAALRDELQNYRLLLQHFVGWRVITEAPCFDPERVTLFDFAVPQQNGVGFMYVLPFSEHEALVEYTLFSPTPLQQAAYEQTLRTWLDSAGSRHYDILETEAGRIPMTDYPFPRRAGQRIMRIGSIGGRVKASTGYAFERIQRDSDAIAHSLATAGHPFHSATAPPRYATFDAMILHIFARRPDLGPRVLQRLFSRNPIERLFRFLDEEGNLAENLLLMATVPWLPFLRAYVALKWNSIIYMRRVPHTHTGAA